MIYKTCARCGAIMPYGSSYCDKCKPIVEAERQARQEQYKRKANSTYNKKRDPKYTRFYNGKDWRILSSKYAQDKGYRCEVCGAIGTEVHHVEPIQTPRGWDRRLDITNLKLLCTDCHNQAHDRFNKRMNYLKRSRGNRV